MDVVELTKRLVQFDTVSQNSNAACTEFLADYLADQGFAVERLSYQDDKQVRKDSLVARKGDGAGGIALLSHSDTVPGASWSSDPWAPRIEGRHLVGLGSCDMKGPLAATVTAATAVPEAQLRRPVYIVVTADEEVSGGGGADQVGKQSQLFEQDGPTEGVIAEPTELLPVHAHKGGARVFVTAHGRAAHTSTDKGESANFKIAPFLARMTELARRFRTDPEFQDGNFTPPTIGFNMILDDGECRPNVAAATSVATLLFRPMPGLDSQKVVAAIRQQAEPFDLEIREQIGTPFYTDPSTPIVRSAVTATGSQPQTVPFGTDAHTFKHYLDLVILGPGGIQQAHTDGEWIDLDQLTQAVAVYSRIIQ